jgi:hypothetical protein
VNFWSRPGSRNSSDDEAVYSLVCVIETASAAAGTNTTQSRIRPMLRLAMRITRSRVPPRPPSATGEPVWREVLAGLPVRLIWLTPEIRARRGRSFISDERYFNLHRQSLKPPRLADLRFGCQA